MVWSNKSGKFSGMQLLLTPKAHLRLSFLFLSIDDVQPKNWQELFTAPMEARAG